MLTYHVTAVRTGFKEIEVYPDACEYINTSDTRKSTSGNLHSKDLRCVMESDFMDSVRKSEVCDILLTI